MVVLKAAKPLGKVNLHGAHFKYLDSVSDSVRHLVVFWCVVGLGTNTDDVTQHSQTHLATISCAVFVPRPSCLHRLITRGDKSATGKPG